jgi:hypothetical protein
MAKKIDLSGFKEFFFNHGEKVALGTCAILGLVLGVWGLWSASSAGRPDGSSKSFNEEFDGRTKAIEAALRSQPVPKLDAIDISKQRWPQIESNYPSVPYAALPEIGGDKRRNPTVLPIRSDGIRMDYLAGLYFAYKTRVDNRNQRIVFGLEDPNVVQGGQPIQPPPPKKTKKDMQPEVPQNIPPFVQATKPVRMVVVHAVFPMKQQVQEYVKMLKVLDQGDLFKNPEDLPRPVGIDVVRFEVVNGVPAKDYKFVVLKDSDQFLINDKLEKVLREAMYDERPAEALEKYVNGGLFMPMPKLANQKYPRFEMPGFEIDWAGLDDPEKNPGAMAADRGPMPPGPPRGKEGGFGKLPGSGSKQRPLPPPPMGEQPGKKPESDMKIVEIPADILKVPFPGLVERLFPRKDKGIEQDVNVFHAMGHKEDDAAPGPADVKFGLPQNQAKAGRYFSAWDVERNENPDKGPGVVVDPKKKRDPKQPMEGAQNAPFPAWDRDAIVRFIDVDVVPGKEYYYSLRVRMANPNKGKENVAWKALATAEELIPSPWVDTKSIKIPQEYHLFAVDQQLLDDWTEGKAPVKGAPEKPQSPSKIYNETAFQIHQWLETKRDLRLGGVGEPYMIGDYAVAERQIVKKGDYIGKDVNVQIPAWNERRSAFEIPNSVRKDAKDNKSKGIHVNLTGKEENAAPLLVDFTGGRRLNPKSFTLDDEAAVDALILMPDGTLKVLNSRQAADVAASVEARDRQERVVSTRKRNDEVRSAGAGGGTGTGPNVNPKTGSGLPGVKGGN